MSERGGEVSDECFFCLSCRWGSCNLSPNDSNNARLCSKRAPFSVGKQIHSTLPHFENDLKWPDNTAFSYFCPLLYAFVRNQQKVSA